MQVSHKEHQDVSDSSCDIQGQPAAARLPSAVEDSLAEVLKDEVGRGIRAATLRSVEHTASCHKPLNYERDSMAFAYLYFGANYAKVLASANRLRLQRNRPLSVLDLGCGAGASTAALLTFLRDRGVAVHRLVALDISASQIALFRRVLSPWLAAEWPGLSWEAACRDASGSTGGGGERFDIVVASHLFCELSPTERKAVSLILDGCRSDYLLIDAWHGSSGARTRSSPWSSLDRDLCHVSLPKISGLNIPIHPKDVVGPKTLPSAATVALLDSYFIAWRDFDIERLRKIFAPGATYRILGNKLLSGISEIEAYWLKNRHEQRWVHTTIGAISEDAKGVSAEWTADFVRVDKHQQYLLHGLLWFEVSAGRISRFVETYDLRMTPTDTATRRDILAGTAP